MTGSAGAPARCVTRLAGHDRKLFGGAPKRAGEAPALPGFSSFIIIHLGELDRRAGWLLHKSTHHPFARIHSRSGSNYRRHYRIASGEQAFRGPRNFALPRNSAGHCGNQIDIHEVDPGSDGFPAVTHRRSPRPSLLLLIAEVSLIATSARFPVTRGWSCNRMRRSDRRIGSIADKMRQHLSHDAAEQTSTDSSLRQPEQTNGGRQAPAVLRVRRMLESLLKMNEGPGGLNQSFEIISIRRFGVEPKLFQDIVRFVVPLFVPATKKRAVIRVSFHVCLVRVHIFPSRFGQPL